MNYSRENLILQNGLIVLTTKDTFFWKYFDDWIVTYKQSTDSNTVTVVGGKLRPGAVIVWS